jgi:hypothetical protein
MSHFLVDIVRYIVRIYIKMPLLNLQEEVVMARNNDSNPEISDKRTNEIAFQIIELLDGVPVSEALQVLDESHAHGVTL